MAPAFQPPWKSQDVFPARPEGSEYGSMTGKKLVQSSREELIRKCAADRVPPVRLVWTPDTPNLVPPAEVPLHKRESPEPSPHFPDSLHKSVLVT